MHAPWPSEYLILGLLAEKPMHGYELARLLSTRQALRDVWQLKRSEVYFLLRKLLDLGYIGEAGEAEAEENAAAGGRPRVIYAPTAAGAAALAAWLRTPEKSPRDLRGAFLAKLYLALGRDRCQALALLAAQRQALAHWAEHLMDLPAGDSFTVMVRKLRLAQVQADLAALDEMRLMVEDSHAQMA